MIDEIIPYYKPLGLTPLEAIEKLRKERPEFTDVAITYAGRLDPMAEGLLLLLAGNAVHKKDEINKLDKTYEAKILLGFSSDTFDVLGLAEHVNSTVQSAQHKNPQVTALFLGTAVNSLVGTHEFEYPNYSSKTVDGKPMWLHTREGSLKNVEIPKREMTVLSAEITKTEDVAWAEIYKTITESINLVSGEFRQAKILAQWKKINFRLQPAKKIQILNITFKVSSGTYVRTLTYELGKLLNTKALLFHLKRTDIGEFKLP